MVIFNAVPPVSREYVTETITQTIGSKQSRFEVRVLSLTPDGWVPTVDESGDRAFLNGTFRQTVEVNIDGMEFDPTDVVLIDTDYPYSETFGEYSIIYEVAERGMVFYTDGLYDADMKEFLPPKVLLKVNMVVFSTDNYSLTQIGTESPTMSERITNIESLLDGEY